MTNKNDCNNSEDGEQEPFEPLEDSMDDPLDESWTSNLAVPGDSEVPEALHSCFTKAPFANCIECGCEILISNKTYVIQKARRNGETVLELAICLDCAQSMQGTMSVESRQTMEEFLADLLPAAASNE